MTQKCTDAYNNYIGTMDSIKDIRIMITSDLFWSVLSNMITSKAYKQVGLIHYSTSSWCNHNFCIDPKLLEELNGELQSILLMTLLHPITPDFSNPIFEMNDLLFFIRIDHLILILLSGFT